MAATLSQPGALERYWRASREPRYSLLFAFPLLLLYEGLAAVLPLRETHGVRNGADVMLKSVFFALAGPRGPLLFEVLLIGWCGWLVWRDLRRRGSRLRPRWFAAMAAESLVLALLFGVVVGMLTARLLGAMGGLAIAPMARLDIWTRLMVSLGAGLYEELLFRVILVSALAFVGQRLFRWRTVPAGVFAAVVGALLFAAAHYIGPYGDRLALGSFLFRFLGGLFFSGLYLVRGFGIDAWTHALYDVLLLL